MTSTEDGEFPAEEHPEYIQNRSYWNPIEGLTFEQ